MKRTFVITLTLALLCSAATASAETVTFAVPAAVGSGTTWSDSAALTTSAAPSVTQTAARNRTSVVHAVDGAGRIDSMTVTYSASSNEAVAGKSYLVTRHNVSSAAGGEVPEAEAAFVSVDNANFGLFRAIERIFGNDTFEIGKTYEAKNRLDAEELLNVPDRTRLQSFAFTPRSVSNGVADFGVTMTMESTPKRKKDGTAPEGRTTVTFTGTLKMTVATVRPLQLSLEGTISESSVKPSRTAGGNVAGTTSMTVDYRF
ncbi:MAG TPA: hypothetical protein VF883_08725 [Thermoanaerobaculia bacterium]